MWRSPNDQFALAIVNGFADQRSVFQYGYRVNYFSNMRCSIIRIVLRQMIEDPIEVVVDFWREFDRRHYI